MLSVLVATAAHAADGFTGELQVVLWEALYPKSSRANLVLELEAQNGAWQRAWGTALGAGNGVHYGRVESGTVDEAGAKLQVAMLLFGDQWQREQGDHFVAYTIQLQRGADGKFAGTFTGTFNGTPATGRATAEIKPVPRPVKPGFVPVATDEHPRLLFRKADLPVLRERLKTPLGQAYWARMDALEKAWKLHQGRRGGADLINMGVIYQLTGEQRFAEAARAMADRILVALDLPLNHDDGGGSGSCGHRAVNLALAYDLCYDAWPAEFRQLVRDRLVEELPMLLKYLVCTSHANNHPCSNFYGPGYGAPAIASLVLFNDKGPAPAKPVAKTDERRVIAPEADCRPGAGVPVVDFAADKMPNQWLVAGPVPAALGGDLLGSIGGADKARPIAGTTLEMVSFVDGRPKTTKLTFQALPAGALTETGLELQKLGADEDASTTALYTVLKVAGDQTVALARGSRQTRVWLAGVELTSKGLYQLQPGLYPLTVVHVTEKSTEPVALQLVAVDEAALAWRRQEQALRETLWKEDHVAWEKTGVDQSLAHLINLGYQRVYRHWRLGIGDGGFQAEAGPAYGEIAAWYPLVYAALYPNVFGRPASPYPDTTQLLPRRLMQVLFPETGKPRVQLINSAAGFDADKCAALWPILPDQYRPTLLWAWNRVAGVTDPAATTKLLNGADLKLALAFLNYPLDMKPEPPGQRMPLTWEAPGFGYHCFRNGWEGKDEFISQVFLKARLISGWNHPNAGTFAIQGLGREWVIGPTKRVGFREQGPHVLLPDDQINEGACGRLTHRQVLPDGSGILTMDLGDVYSSAKGGRLYDGNLLRIARRLQPSGITGLRAFAFDYSGQSGAPLLLALVDKIDGGKRRIWQWTLPEGAIGATKVTENGFTIDYGDASMNLTFVHPVKPSVRAGADQAHIGLLGDDHRSFEGVIPRVQATGNDHFFAVATFQRGPAPAVKVEGAGLDATVTVGNQRIRFDGTKIVLGQ